MYPTRISDFIPRLYGRWGIWIAYGHFLWGAEVVAVVPAQDVDFRGDRFVGPNGVGLVVVLAAVVRLLKQAYAVVAQGLGHRHEGAGFVEVVNGAAGVGFEQWRGVFPCQGVAVPAVQGVVAAQFALFAGVLVDVPARSGLGFFSVVRF